MLAYDALKTAEKSLETSLAMVHHVHVRPIRKAYFARLAEVSGQTPTSVTALQWWALESFPIVIS